jgi:nuclear transport factor 2 (NTF2) superfamily protein
MSHKTQQLFKPTDLRPPFTLESARAKVKAAEDAWNTCDPEKVARAYSEDSQ